jgi:filamentous hemagglutinin family protein
MNLRLPCVLGSALLTFTAASSAGATELPAPCVAGSCGPGVAGFVQSGQATAVATGGTLRVDQTSDKAALNWASFNISADGRVVFNQPTSSSVALNRIYQDSPSRIFGALEANGQVYLVNQNGLIFGPTARVKTAGLLASTLNISDATFASGLVAPEILGKGQAALASDGRASVLDANGNPVLGPDGKPLQIQILVQPGAQISTNTPGARVLIASRKVDNAGSIQAPDGQVVLAAGEKVYLQPSSDSSLRGLLVEVDSGGEAWNRLTGDISAARGNVTIAALAVNQAGRISATTSVSSNGSIRLLGRDSVKIVPGSPISATHTGTVELGPNSVTSVTPELQDTATAIDDQPQAPSSIEINAHQVTLRGGSQVIAPGGTLQLTANANPTAYTPFDPQSQIHVESGARIDLSGSAASVSVARNLVTVDLRANELKDDPTQRDGLLRGQTVVVDARVKTPLADVQGAIDAIPRTVAERTSKGGTVKLNSEGDLVVASGAQMSVSGGRIDYQGAYMQTTQLMTADGKLVDIGSADPLRTYIAVVNPTITRRFNRWGVTETSVGTLLGRFEAGYIEGKDAGTLSFAAPNMVLNGSFAGSAVAGPLQRSPSVAPHGGTFLIGVPQGVGGGNPPDYRSPSVTLVNRPPNIVVGDGASLLGPRPLELPVDPLANGGFGSIQIFSNGTFTLPENTPLTLLAGSSLQIVAERVDLRSNISAPSGSLSFTAAGTAGIPGGTLQQARGVFVGDKVSLDVRGLWINDPLNIANQSTSLPVLNIAGGSIELATRAFLTADGKIVAGQLNIGSDVRLRASGGAWVRPDGSVSPGNGGSIALRSGQAESTPQLGTHIGIDAFGVLGATGGSFTLEAGRLAIVHAPTWLADQKPDPAAPAAGSSSTSAVQIGDSLFSDHGFSKFDLTATGPRASASALDVLTIASNAVVDTRSRSLVLRADWTQHPNATSVADFAAATLPIVGLRTPSTANFRVDPHDFNGTLGQSPGARVGQLSAQAGSVLLGDPKSSFSFTSPGGVLLAGQISAPGGSIVASVPMPRTEFDIGYQRDLRIEVGGSALLDVSGSELLTPNDAGFRFGSVLAGGTISLLANRGSVAVQAGAQLNVSGATSALDIPAGSQATSYARQKVGSGGGSVTLRAPESVSMLGTLAAAGGMGETRRAPGGALTVQLTRNLARGFGPPEDTNLAATFPTNPRTLRVSSTVPLTGDRLPDGLGIISSRLIQSSGVDALTLESSDEVRFDAGVELALGRKLIVDSPSVDLGGASAPVRLAAPYIAFGSSLVRPTPGSALSGDARLQVQGDLIDLIGSSVLQHVASASFTSTGDLRLRGVVQSANVGSLTLAGDLTLAAARVFPTTASAFTIALPGDSSVLRIAQTNTLSGAPLSAAGSVTLSAGTISQGGTLLAPFGTLALNASKSVQLLDGSITSVSAQGALIPYGQVRFGNQWSYSLTGGDANPVQQAQIPERRVSINGAEVNIAAHATVDLAGGGDLYAYTWMPGTGGSKDALAPGVRPGLYAILPGLAGQSAPYDPQEFAATDLSPGDSVYLSGIEGLAAGAYALLPARYALLPGAYLVQAVPGFADQQPSRPGALADGTPVVAGYRTFAQTGLGDTRYSGFAVWRGDYGRKLASYQDSFASSFFPQQAARAALGRVAVPADAGNLSIAVTRALQGLGQVLTGAGNGGVRSEIDLSAPALNIAAGSAANATPGVVQLDSNVLAQWNPGTLVLGGRRDPSTGKVTVESNAVSFLAGSQLALQEIVAVARNQISIAANASVSSTAAPSTTTVKERPLVLTGSGADQAAALAVSNRTRFIVQRPPSTGSPQGPGSSGARVDIAAGAQLASSGSLLLDAPGGGQLEGALSGRGAQWDIAAQRIAFADQAAAGRFTISSGLASRMQEGAAVHLAGTDGIDFLAAMQFGAPAGGARLGTLSLTAPKITASGAVDVRLSAGAVELKGTGASLPNQLASGSGSITLSADNMRVLGNAMSFEGFATTSLQSGGRLVAEDSAAIAAAGDLQLAAGRITTTTGANATFQSGGLLRVASAGADPGPGASMPLGGRLALTGRDLDIRGRLVLPSGVIELSSQRQLSIGSGSVLDVSGTTVVAGGRAVGSPGGRIKLSAGSDISGATDSLLRLDASGTADGGILSVVSGGRTDLRSMLSATADSSARGASVLIDAGSLQDFSDLNSRLEAGGFSELRSVHVAHGDLTLQAGGTATAHHVKWSTDDGGIRIDGTIKAPSTEAQRAQIELFAQGAVTLGSSGVLRAQGLGSIGRGGLITLGSSSGRVSLAPGSQVDTRGAAENGRVLIRAAAIGNDVAVDQLGSTLTGVSAVTVEPVLAYDAPATLTSTDFDVYRGLATAFIDAAGQNIRSRLVPGGGTRLVLQPGVELRRAGDLQIAGADLTSWRFNGDPGAITFRATGSISITGILSDGFANGTRGPVLPPPESSTSSATLRFAAGSVLTAADPLTVSRDAASDLILSGATIRTGTGDLQLAASRDVLFAGTTSVYTAGRAGAPTELNPRLPVFNFPTGGGQLQISAGRDIVGNDFVQSVGEWQPRFGRTDQPIRRLVRWGVALEQFGWNVGTLGGGDLSLSAGRDVRDLTAAAADTGIEQTPGVLTQFAGGVLDIEAGRDASSNFLHVTNGINRVRAGGAIGATRPSTDGRNLGTLLSVENARVELTARGDIALETAFNPTLLDERNVFNSNLLSYFATYGARSALTAQSLAGDVAIGTDSNRLAAIMGSEAGTASPAVTFLPPVLQLRSLSRDVRVSGTSTLFPSDTGQLDLFAARDLVAESSLTLSDIPSSAIPLPLSAQSTSRGSVFEALGRSRTSSAASSRHLDDPEPAYLTAGRDIIGGGQYALAKSARVVAGRDIVNLSLLAQNVRTTDRTVIIAGRDFRYSQDATTGEVRIGGAGALDVLAGRDVDLGFSTGISTVGRLTNPTLPSSRGADVTVLAGLTSSIDVNRIATFFKDLVAAGRDANLHPATGYRQGYAAIDSLFPGSRPVSGSTSPYSGDLRLAFSRIYTLAGGDISLLVPGGLVDVGLAMAPIGAPVRKPSDLGIVAQRAGSVDIFASGDVLVNQSRIFTLGGGDIAIWSTTGNIDAGRGSKSAISAPPPTIVVDALGNVRIDLAGAVAGSGIRGILTDPSLKPGSVDLIAPAGTVNAGDAGIGSAGNLNIAAQHVVGLDNIQVGGASTGVPAQTSNLAASLSGASAVGSSATSKSEAAAGQATASDQSKAPIAASALGWLDVFIEGFGEETCKPSDAECLGRQKRSHP